MAFNNGMENNMNMMNNNIPNTINNNFPNMMNNNMINNSSPNMMNNFGNNNNNMPNIMFNNLPNNNMIQNNNNMNDLSKMNITFKTTDDTILNMIVDSEMTVDALLKQFCGEFGHPEYIGTYNKIKFIYKAGLLRFEDQTPILMKFMSREPQKIIVHNVDGLIG